MQISKITFYVNSLKDAPRAAEHHYLTTSQTITNSQTFQVMTIYAFFDVWLFTKILRDDVNVKRKKLFNDYCVYLDIALNEFVGMNSLDFVGIKTIFKINLIAYKFEGV